MLGLASRTIGRILYGSDMATAPPQEMRFDYINEEMLRRSVSRHPLPMWLPAPANRKLRDGLSVLRWLVTDIIAARRAQGEEGATDDMLGLLLTARDVEEDSGPLTDEEVIDQVLVFMLAGHDTTSTTLACSLLELARHPVWQQEVREELQRELGDRPPSAFDATHLPLTARVAREAMRLYPASHSIGRSPIGDQVLGGYRLPAASTVVVSTYALHRSPDSWDHPDEFDPGRYDVPDGVVPGGHKQAWMAFGSGPHTCVGMTLATQMITVVLATLLQQVRLTTALSTVPVHAAMTLRPVGALPVVVHR